MLDFYFAAPPGNLTSTVFWGILGLLFGSFLNVVIHRIPKMMQREIDNFIAEESGAKPAHAEPYNLMVPRSACPHCGHQITAAENIPILSYLLIGGKCKACKAPISSRYPIVEAITGVITAYVVWQFGSGVAGISAIIFACLLIALTGIDLDTQLLPDSLTLPLLWLGLAVNIQFTFVPLEQAVIGAMAGYLSLWSVYWLFKLVTGKEGMGYGDFKLLAALGAWLGWQALPQIILLSSIVGAVVGIALIVSGKLGKGKPIPFGPYLAGAGLIAMIWGKQINTLYFNLFT